MVKTVIPCKILKQKHFPINSCSQGFVRFQINVSVGVHLQKSSKSQNFNKGRLSFVVPLGILKIFRTTILRHSLSLVELKNCLLWLFWRWTPQMTFIWNPIKPFEQLFQGKRSCFNILEGITTFPNYHLFMNSDNKDYLLFV